MATGERPLVLSPIRSTGYPVGNWIISCSVSPKCRRFTGSALVIYVSDEPRAQDDDTLTTNDCPSEKITAVISSAMRTSRGIGSSNELLSSTTDGMLSSGRPATKN